MTIGHLEIPVTSNCTSHVRMNFLSISVENSISLISEFIFPLSSWSPIPPFSYSHLFLSLLSRHRSIPISTLLHFWCDLLRHGLCFPLLYFLLTYQILSLFQLFLFFLLFNPFLEFVEIVSSFFQSFLYLTHHPTVPVPTTNFLSWKPEKVFSLNSEPSPLWLLVSL